MLQMNLANSTKIVRNAGVAYFVEFVNQWKSTDSSLMQKMNNRSFDELPNEFLAAEFLNEPVFKSFASFLIDCPKLSNEDELLMAKTATGYWSATKEYFSELCGSSNWISDEDVTHLRNYIFRRIGVRQQILGENIANKAPAIGMTLLKAIGASLLLNDDRDSYKKHAVFCQLATGVARSGEPALLNFNKMTIDGDAELLNTVYACRKTGEDKLMPMMPAFNCLERCAIHSLCLGCESGAISTRSISGQMLLYPELAYLKGKVLL